MTRARIIKRTTADGRLGVPAAIPLGTEVDVELDSAHVMVRVSTPAYETGSGKAHVQIETWIARELLEVIES